LKKPESAATIRKRELGLKDDWENEFFSPIKFTDAVGLGYEPGVHRGDPSHIIKVGSTYYVWYLKTTYPPYVGYENSTETLRASPWDLGSIWYATSEDGYVWKEQGKALARGEKGSFDDRSVFTPNILVAEDKCYLFYQAVSSPYRVRTRNVIAMAYSDSPDGPWTKWPEPVLRTGEGGEWLGDEDNIYLVKSKGPWDSHKVHDPCLIKRDGKYWLYYKGHQMGTPDGAKWGVAIADKPKGPYVKHELNPLTNSGHGVVVWPYKEGICGYMSDGPEKNTVQYAPDGLNFEPKAHLWDRLCQAGPYRPDAFDDIKWGQGITWGLSCRYERFWWYMVRFECDLRSDRYMKTMDDWVQGRQFI
jgi:hypothetical protein